MVVLLPLYFILHPFHHHLLYYYHYPLLCLFSKHDVFIYLCLSYTPLVVLCKWYFPHFDSTCCFTDYLIVQFIYHFKMFAFQNFQNVKGYVENTWWHQLWQGTLFNSWNLHKYDVRFLSNNHFWNKKSHNKNRLTCKHYWGKWLMIDIIKFFE